MKARTLIILAIVVAGLLAFIVFYEGDLPSSEERAEQANRVLGGLVTSKVEAVDIAWGDQHVRLEKQTPPKKEEAEEGEEAGETAAPAALPAEETWKLVEPLQARADRSLVSQLLGHLLSLDKKRTLKDEDRKAAGLDSPAATVTLTTDSGDRVVRFGSEVPVSKDRLVAVDQDPEVFVVRASIWPDLTREPGDWRDKKMVPMTRNDIDRVVVSRSDLAGNIVLAREGEAFQLEAPIADRADRDKVRSFLGRLADLRAQSFVDDAGDLSAIGLDPPRETVVASGTSNDAAESLKLEVGAAKQASEGNDGSTYGRIGKQVFVFRNKDLVADLERPAADWRSTEWSAMQVFSIQSLKVEDGRGELTVERTGSDWNRGEDRIPYTPVSDLLYAVTETKADRLVSADEAKAQGWKLDTPTHTLTITAENQPDETLTLYPPVKDGLPAKASDRDPVLLLSADRLETLDKAIAAVRDAKPIVEPDQKDETQGDDEATDIQTEEGEGEPPAADAGGGSSG